MISALVDLLGSYYQAGNWDQLEIVARTMLAAMPDDIVSLQFLGLALYEAGRHTDAYLAFGQAASRLDGQPGERFETTCDRAASITFRTAIHPHSGLADGWWHIAGALTKFGFRKAAHSACRAALSSQGGRRLQSRLPKYS